MEDNGKNEHDVSERRITFGPIVGAIAIFFMLALSNVGTWYMTRENCKGDIAESEVGVRKDDTKVALDLDADHERRLKGVEGSLTTNPYDTDCANMSITDMRNRMRESEEH